MAKLTTTMTATIDTKNFVRECEKAAAAIRKVIDAYNDLPEKIKVESDGKSG